MPLLDHFHPPLSGRRHWESFHARWAGAISDALNEVLPEDYFAEQQAHHGPRVEVDIATFQEALKDSGGVATIPRTQAKLVTADLVVDLDFPPQYGVNVFESSGGPRLVAAIELVSPGNKDRPDTRRAFAAKCFTYVQQGCGLIVVDVVTSRQGRILEDLLALIAPEQPKAAASSLAAISCRPLRSDRDQLELRIRPLEVGKPLPTLPLALNAALWVDVDFEATYSDACSRSRL